MNTDYKQTITANADTLIAARKEWEQGTMKASNDELYVLLARCFDFYLAVSRSYDLPKALNELLTQRGFTYTNSTSLPLKVVRLVFADPKEQERYKHRLLTYARVLTIAKEQKQTAEQLPAFIEQNGGIDEIRRQGATGETKADKEKKQREAASIELASDDTSALLQIPQLPDQLQPAEGERYSIALVRKNTDGSGSIVFGTENKTALSTVLTLAGKKIAEDFIKSAEQKQEQKVFERQDANMQKLEEQQAKSFSPELSADLKEALVAETIS